VKSSLMGQGIEYEAPQAQVCGAFLCDSVADTVFSPVRRVDVTDWVDGGEVTGTDGGDVFLTL
jgi:hypothetical protein